MPTQVEPTPCRRCGAPATLITLTLLGVALSRFRYRRGLRFWCRPCYEWSARLGVLLGKAIGWGVTLAIVVAALWWRAHR